MFGNLLKSFTRQVVIIKAHNIPKKFLTISEISTTLLLNYWTRIWKEITQDKKSRAGWTKNQGHWQRRQKRFCPDNFFVLTTFLSRIFFVQTIFLSGQFFCPDNFFVRTIFLSGQKGIYHQVEFCRWSLLEKSDLHHLGVQSMLNSKWRVKKWKGEKTKKVCPHEGTQLVNQKLIMLQFSRHFW